MNTQDIQKRREKEKQTVVMMIEIYCHKNHSTKGTQLCKECNELAEYAKRRVQYCPHMETKTFCSSCKTHCYDVVMREKIRKVMRFSGPRMLIYCPKIVFLHKLEHVRRCFELSKKQYK